MRAPPGAWMHLFNYVHVCVILESGTAEAPVWVVHAAGRTYKLDELPEVKEGPWFRVEVQTAAPFPRFAWVNGAHVAALVEASVSLTLIDLAGGPRLWVEAYIVDIDTLLGEAGRNPRGIRLEG